MKPKFAAGDLVSDWDCTHRGLVVGVMPSNQVPDALVRGLRPEMYGWLYYVMFSDPPKVHGPLPSAWLHSVP